MENQLNLKNFINSKESDTMTRSSCLRRIDEIAESCGKIPLARLFTIILRKKEGLKNDPYFWSEKTFLKKLEQYQKEFSESYNPITGEFDLNEE